MERVTRNVARSLLERPCSDAVLSNELRLTGMIFRGSQPVNYEYKIGKCNYHMYDALALRTR